MLRKKFVVVVLVLVAGYQLLKIFVFQLPVMNKPYVQMYTSV